MHKPFFNTHSSNESILSSEEYAKYAKHIIIPKIQKQGQMLLKQSRILSVGAGGLASASLLYLTGSGIGSIGIVDHDNIEKSNLHRQLLYTEADIGDNKSLCAKKTLQHINSSCNIKIFNEKFNSYNAHNIVQEYDIILDNTDNFETRWLISEICKTLHKVHIYGAISTFTGQLSVFNYQGGPHYYDLNQYIQRQNDNICNSHGVLSILPGLIGLLQATETIKIILGLGTILSGKVMYYDMIKNQFKTLSLRQTYNYPELNTYLYDNYIKSRLSQEILHKSISLKELDIMLSNNIQIYLIDIREYQEYAIEHIYRAINIPLNKFQNYQNQAILAQKSVDNRIIIYCNSLSRTYIASLIMSHKSIPHAILHI